MLLQTYNKTDLKKYFSNSDIFNTSKSTEILLPEDAKALLLFNIHMFRMLRQQLRK